MLPKRRGTMPRPLLTRQACSSSETLVLADLWVSLGQACCSPLSFLVYIGLGVLHACSLSKASWKTFICVTE